MKKIILLAAAWLSMLSATAQGMKNAVCVTKTDGTMEYVALNSSVELATSANASLQIMDGDKIVHEIKLNEVKEVTLAEHDFTATGIDRIKGLRNNNENVEIYDINGKKVSEVTPGKVYIIKSGSTVKKITK